MALRYISEVLKLHGHTLSSLNLPSFNIDSIPNNQDTKYHSQFGRTYRLGGSNEDERSIINLIMNVVRNNDASVTNAYFIDGSGGAGRTFLYQCLINSCALLGFDVVSVAWTGIAAMLLSNGRTVHSKFKLPLNLHEHSVSGLKVNSKEASQIR